MDDSDSNKILPDIFLEKISDAYSYCQIITDETGKPSDYQFLNINVAFARLIGLGLNEVVGKKISELETKCKSMRCDLIQFFGDVALNGKEAEFQLFSDSEKKLYDGIAFSPSYGYFITLCSEVIIENHEIASLILDGTIITHGNEKMLEMLGYSVKDVVNSDLFDHIHPDDIQKTHQALFLVKEKETRPSLINRVQCSDGSHRYIEWTFHEYGKLVFATIKDITEKTKGETNQALYSKILSILNEPINIDESISKILVELKEYIGADAVGIRLEEESDYPYYIHNGFSEDFLLKENSLIERNKSGQVCRNKDGSLSLECTCGLIITGNTDPNNPLFTDYGSALTNNSFPFLDVPETDDPRHNPRNQCIHEGYASIALIPIKIKDDIIGILQANSYKKNLFSSHDANLFEHIAANIGQALRRKQVESELNKTHKKLEAFIEHTPLLISELTTNGRYLRANKSFCDYVGHTKDEIIGRKLEEILSKETTECLKQNVEQVTSNKEYLIYEDIVYINDEQLTFNVVLYPLFDKNGKVSSIGIISEDITDLKKIAEMEKYEVIIHEIHHRVKNNLQVIISLLSMQSRLHKDNRLIQDIINDSQNRIHSMSIAHEKLYRTSKVASIEMSDYISNLASSISQNYNSYEKPIDTRLDLDTIYLDMDYAIPLGLILNEILTNSYKHAFKDKDHGSISISFNDLDNIYKLTVEDDGIGLDYDLDCEDSKTVGLKIINLLSKQLLSEIELDGSKGTRYTIKLNKSNLP